MPRKFTLPVPEGQDALQELMAAGWQLEARHDEEARMIPPPELERAYGFAEFMRFARWELDAVWTEAEAALPEGWTIVIDGSTPNGFLAQAGYPSPGGIGELTSENVKPVQGDTPAAALHALAAKLRDR